ncbi:MULTISPECIES: helix-turn-helix transcriptional regulator [Pseudomonas]|uniref:helix-turn-helix transcriptional regulator n=1 Tax=Pseudomonas TaxID=286 RepID=UPI000EC46688|nr:AlpA family phage regulatory protein [Pseudomonas citronellolis]GBL59225.1 transcriptional regulator [Pseudomonas citronellolis]
MSEQQPNFDTLLKLPEVSRQVGFGKSAIYEMIAAGAFPEPIKLGCASRWSQMEIQAWIETQKSSRKVA